MQITITLTLTESEFIQLRDNSIERVLNNAASVGSKVERLARGSLSEQASALWQDADELNTITTKLWNAARNAAFEKV